MLVRYGQRPNELTVKKLAMLGCVTLVLAHSVKDIRERLQNNAYAGDLLSHDTHIRTFSKSSNRDAHHLIWETEQNNCKHEKWQGHVVTGN